MNFLIFFGVAVMHWPCIFGENYESISHPANEYFQPQKDGVKGYHFVAQPTVPYNPNLYDYRNPTTTVSHDPVLYNYYPPNADDSSEEENGRYRNTMASDPQDYFVVGVENMLLHGSYKDNQHLVLLIVQESDGLSAADGTTDSDNENHYTSEKYFPDSEFVFYSDDEPTDDDLSALNSKLKEMILQRKC